MFAESSHERGDGRGKLVGLAAVALLLVGVGVWLFVGRDAGAPPDAAVATDVTEPDTPEEDNAAPAPDERTPPARSSAAPAPKASRSPTPASSPAAPPAPVASAPTLRVESDVPGAMVFLNRKYLGTTPLVSRDVSPGSYQLNVQAEGIEPVVQTVEIGDAGETSVSVALKTVRLDARVPVVHKHGIGSCDGVLSATPAGLRYQTSHDKDGFTLTFSQLETFSVDYLDKALRVKQRGGRTWNFTTRDDNADPLYVFHKEVEAAR